MEHPTSENDRPAPVRNLGAIVLCGGRSSRMGSPKDELLLHGKTFLEHVIERASAVAKPIVVVGQVTRKNALADGAGFPQVCFRNDENENCGPLEGIRIGLETLSGQTELAFVTGCDAPLIEPRLIAHLAGLIGEHQAVIPFAGTRIYGMTAVYRTNIAAEVGQLIEQGELRVQSMAKVLDALLVDVESLRSSDGGLQSFLNVNTPAEYQNLLQRNFST